MKNFTCFSFWLPDQEATALKNAQKEASEREKKKVSVGSIVKPAIRRFIDKELYK